MIGKPTELGYYWASWLCPISGNGEPEIVNVARDKDGSIKVYSQDRPPTDWFHYWRFIAGPIPRPSKDEK